MMNSTEFNTKYVIDALGSFSEGMGNLCNEWDDIYKSSDIIWPEYNPFINNLSPDSNEVKLYNDEFIKIAVWLDRVCTQIRDKKNPVGIYRFLGDNARDSLKLLLKLENFFTVTKEAYLIANLIPSETTTKWIGSDKYGGKPPKDHVFHIANLLFQGLWFLEQKCSNGNILYKEIFQRLQNSWWRNIEDREINSAIIDINKDDTLIKRFVFDLWIFTVLIHDVGYTICLELLLSKVRVNDTPEPINDLVNKIKNWVNISRRNSRNIIKDELGDNFLKTKLFLPTINYLMQNNSYLEKPEKLHGILSGYIVLHRFFNMQKNGNSIFKLLSPLEKLSLLTVCNSAIVHTISDEKIKKDMKRETKSAKEKVLIDDPLGMLLYAIDSIQEWNRIVWVHEEGKVAKSISFDSSLKTQKENGLVNWEGLSFLIGQTAIPNCKTSLSNGLLYIFFDERKYEKDSENSSNDFVIQKKYFDFVKLIHSDQKEIILPFILKQLVGIETIIFECTLCKMTIVADKSVIEFNDEYKVTYDTNEAKKQTISFRKGDKGIRYFDSNKLIIKDSYDNVINDDYTLK
jgi:hypothetical protein